MKNLRIPLALALTTFGTLLMTGCQRHGKSETYYLIANNLKLPYWKTVNAGFTRAAADYGVTAQLRGPDTYDAQAETEALRKVIAARPAGILVSVADAAMMKPDIDAAVAAGVPVITVDSDAPRSSRLFFIGTNNLAAGRLGGQRLAQKLGGKGRVVFFTMPGQPNLDERLKGYLDVLGEHPQMKVVDVFNIKGDSGSAFDQAGRLVAQTGAEKIDAFVCLEAASGKEIAEVLKRSNAADRTLIAMDVDPETLQLIKSGNIDSTVSQKPYTMGYVGLKALDEVHHYLPKPLQANYQIDSFAPYPVFVDTGTSLVDKSNIDVYLSGDSQLKAN